MIFIVIIYIIFSLWAYCKKNTRKKQLALSSKFKLFHHLSIGNCNPHTPPKWDSRWRCAWKHSSRPTHTASGPPWSPNRGRKVKGTRTIVQRSRPCSPPCWKTEPMRSGCWWLLELDGESMCISTNLLGRIIHEDFLFLFHFCFCSLFPWVYSGWGLWEICKTVMGCRYFIAVVAEWIRPQTLNREVPGSNLAAAVVSLDKALYSHCLVSRKGLKVVGPLIDCLFKLAFLVARLNKSKSK